MMQRTLADLRGGERAVLREVGGAPAYRRRLLELGFLPGTEVRVVRAVPVGDVLEVELRQARVSLRISEAAVIRVEPIGAAQGETDDRSAATRDRPRQPGAPTCEAPAAVTRAHAPGGRAAGCADGCGCGAAASGAEALPSRGPRVLAAPRAGERAP